MQGTISPEEYARQQVINAVVEGFNKELRKRLSVQDKEGIAEIARAFRVSLTLEPGLDFGVEGLMLGKDMVSPSDDEKIKAVRESGEVIGKVAFLLLTDYMKMQSSLWSRIKFLFMGVKLDALKRI